MLGVLTALLAMRVDAAAADALRSDTKKFFPISSQAQAGQQPIALKKNDATLRSDFRQMKNGFMRIDRARSAAPMMVVSPETQEKQVSAAQPVLLPGSEPIAPESEEIAGNRERYDPVLALFGGQDAAGGGPSFRDAMLGTATPQPPAGAQMHSGWPVPLSVPQYISSRYGMRSDPFTRRPTFHGGIDIAASEGTPVLATAEGDVVEVKVDANYGKYITLRHADGTRSRYGHLSAQEVREGQRVRTGQVIGAVGSTGRSTGAHLDYRVSRNEMKFDPLMILRVPAGITFGVGSAVADAAHRRAPSARVASNALAKRALVIKVQ